MSDLPGPPPAPPVFRAKPLEAGPPPRAPRRLLLANWCWVLAALSALPLAILSQDLLDAASSALYDRLSPATDPSDSDALREVSNNAPVWLTYAQLLLGVVNLLGSVFMTARRSLSARSILVITGTVTMVVSALWHVVVLAMSQAADPAAQVLSFFQLLLVIGGIALMLGQDAKGWLRP